MPKGRHLKPDFFTDKHVVSVSPLARLLYQGLWCYAADCGHLDDEPLEFKMRILPADVCDVGTLLAELVTASRIERAHGVIFLPKLRDHARVDKRYETFCPACKFTDHDVTTTGTRRDHAGTTPKHVVDGDGDGEVMVKVTPSSEVADATPDPARLDVTRLCTHLAQRIEANTGNPPNITKRWRDAARLMLDRDGRTEAKVHACIDWCQDDEFWRTNILSMPKLREKYDQLSLKARQRVKPADAPTPIPPRFVPPTPQRTQPDSAGKARDALRQAKDTPREDTAE